MAPELSNPKSFVERAVEALLAKRASKLDGKTRRERVIAAMVMECAETGHYLAKVANVAKRAQVSTATIYRDFGNRDALFVKAVEWVIGLASEGLVTRTDETDPIKRLEALLLSHGKVLADPFIGRLLRLYIHLAHTSAPHLLALGRAVRGANLAAWRSEIAQLVKNGHLIKTDADLVVAIMLGAIERRTILARLSFGEDDDREPTLGAVAKHMAFSIFEVFGTPAFWSSRGESYKSERIENRTYADHGKSRRQPIVLMDPPSHRLRAYAERILAKNANRLDSESRKIRVQLAAMLECMENGYEAATMASVAARAGVSTATFYDDYSDKRALFTDAILLQARFKIDFSKLIDPDISAADTIAAIVFSFASVLADPDFLWFHRISMSSEISDSPQLIQSARATRTYTERCWFDYFSGLEKAELINAHDQALTINALLGATQRRSVLSMVLFGIDDVCSDELGRLSLASSDFVMRLTNPDFGRQVLTTSK